MPSRGVRMVAITRRQRFGWSIFVSVLLVPLGAAQQLVPAPAFIRTASTNDRAAYLAAAVIWRDPGFLTPDQIRFGPPADIPDVLRLAGQRVECRFDRPGKDLGGRTQKF